VSPISQLWSVGYCRDAPPRPTLDRRQLLLRASFFRVEDIPHQFIYSKAREDLIAPQVISDSTKEHTMENYTGRKVALQETPLRGAFFSFFWEGLSLQAKQRSAPPQKPRVCLSQAPTKRGVCASLPAALLPVDATHP
jgi:hypothetical protein